MKRLKTYQKITAVLISGSLVLISAAACTRTGVTSSEDTKEASSDVFPSTSISAEEAFTDKDLEIGYDDSAAQPIVLTGTTASSTSASVKVDGSHVTITDEGTYVITGTLDDGYIVVDADKEDEIRIVLKGASITSSDYAALYCLNADNVYITLENNTENALVNEGEFNSKDDNNVDGAVFAKTDLTINGSGSLSISSSAHGIVSKDNIMITGGTISVTAEKDGIQANDSVAVQNSTIDITCGKDGIQADNDDDQSKGYVFISSGDITISAGDDGITASTTLQIDDGSVNITRSYEGIEGQNITINGGTINIVSSDDALNAVSDNSSGDMMRSDGVSSLIINGGDIYLRSDGDGVDSNGSFEMTGGTLTVMGPVMGGNGSLDVTGDANITGGTVIMAGTSDMATNFTKASQGSILLTTGNQSEGSEITVTDASGNVITKVTADCSYQSVLISSPDLVKGNTYTVTAGNYSETVTLSDYIYGTGSGFGPGGMPGGRNPGDMPGGDMGDFPGNRPDNNQGNFPGGGREKPQ